MTEYDEQMERDKEQIVRQYEANKDACIEILIGKIINISLDVPKVVVQKFEEVQ